MEVEKISKKLYRRKNTIGVKLVKMTDKSAEPVPTVVNGHTFTIDTRYVLRDSRILGKGSFGDVCTAYDSIRKIDIAIKRIRPYANDEWDAKHTLREIRLLKLLGPHPNVRYSLQLLYDQNLPFYLCRLSHFMSFHCLRRKLNFI